MSTITTTPEITRKSDELAERVLGSAVAALELFSIYLGDKLGFYLALADHGPATSGQLATRTGADERYVREWLEQQAVSGLLSVENPPAQPADRRFYLPEGHEEVLANRESLNFLTPLAQLVVGATYPLGKLLGAYRTGQGVPFTAYGPDCIEGQARINRTMFLQLLGSEWLPSIRDVHARLVSDPPARVADIGCGAGWSSIGIARSYPKSVVDGFDLDEASIKLANRNAAENGLRSRVTFQAKDAAKAGGAGQYDLVLAIECVHDMSDPVTVLKTMKKLAKPTGAVLVIDERVAEQFQPEAGLIERMMYGWSILHCLPVGMAGQPSAGTGTVMRPAILEGYARKAGFSRLEVLPIDHLFFRFYRLHR